MISRTTLELGFPTPPLREEDNTRFEVPSAPAQEEADFQHQRQGTPQPPLPETWWEGSWVRSGQNLLRRTGLLSNSETFSERYGEARFLLRPQNEAEERNALTRERLGHNSSVRNVENYFRARFSSSSSATSRPFDGLIPPFPEELVDSLRSPYLGETMGLDGLAYQAEPHAAPQISLVRPTPPSPALVIQRTYAAVASSSLVRPQDLGTISFAELAHRHPPTMRPSSQAEIDFHAFFFPPACLFAADRIRLTGLHDSNVWFETFQEGLSFWQTAAQSGPPGSILELEVMPRADSFDLDLRKQKTLTEFLLRLTGTRDFSNHCSRHRLATRVHAVLNVMSKSADVRDICLETMFYALQSCGDRIGLALNEIEIQVLIFRAQHAENAASQLYEVGLSIMRREIVHTHARAKCMAHPELDSIEVYFAYEVGLRLRLNLPGLSEEMLYPKCGMVSDQDLDSAEKVAREKSENAAETKAFFDTWSCWQRHLRHQEASRWLYRDAPSNPSLDSQTYKSSFCLISGDAFEDLKEPLLWTRHQAHVLYEAQLLLQWWTEKGTEPSTSQPVTLGEFSRVAVDSADL